MQAIPHPVPKTDSPKPVLALLQRLTERMPNRLKAHGEVLWFFLSRILPLMLSTRRRPVLFSRYMALGDVICAFPAALELKKRHPGAAFIFHCRKDYNCLPRLGGVTTHMVDHLNVPLIEDKYSFLFAAIYKFTYSDENENCPAKEAVVAEFCRQHQVPIAENHPRLETDPAAVVQVKAILKQHQLDNGPLIVIHPGPTWIVREWPLTAWTQLVQGLMDAGYKNIVQLGSGQAGTVGSALDKPIPGVVSLVNKLTLEETIALISLSKLLAGIDSGLLHIAAAVRTPAIGIFGPTSAQFRFGPAACVTSVAGAVDCQGCHHRVPRLHWITGCPHDVVCMKSITPDRVLQSCKSILEPAVQPPALVPH